MIQVFPVTLPPANTPVTDSKGALNNDGMAFFRALWNRTGQGNGLQFQVSDIDSGDITTDWVQVSGASATLPSLTGGQFIVVQNTSGGNLAISPPSGATIDGGPIYSIAASKMQIFWFFSASQIFSTQLG